MGSFISTSAAAWPDGGQILQRRSKCDACQTSLAVFDLVPILSYLALRGKCRSCQSKITTSHLATEIIAASIAIVAVSIFDGWLQWATATLGWILLFTSLVDLRLKVLPDIASFILIPLGALILFWQLNTTGLWLSLSGAMIGYGVFFMISALYRRLRGREGLGLGDAKLLAVGGAWCGPLAVSWIVLLAASFALASLIFSKNKLKADTRLAFGPALAIAIFVVWLWTGHDGQALRLL